MKQSVVELKTPFKLFEDCFLTKGYKRGLIIDITHSSFCVIPNDMCEIIEKYDGQTIQSILDTINSKANSKVILSYFKFLLSNNLIFFTQTPELFSRINICKSKPPFKVYQAILDIKNDTSFLNDKLFKSLNNLNCKYLQIRIYESISIEELQKILVQIDDTSIIGIEIYLKYKSKYEIRKTIPVFQQSHRVNNVFYYNSIKNEYFIKKNSKTPFNVNLIKQNIIGCLNCGVISQDYFSINLKSYIKSINTNSCLSGKISVDINGDIKNCPSMKENYGNLKNTTLEDALKKPTFEKYWNVRKDDIAVCKDCEFRHICIDCRAYTEDPKDIYSKPLKCGYNPYINVWEEWSTNPLNTMSIEYYGLEDIIKA